MTISDDEEDADDPQPVSLHTQKPVTAPKPITRVIPQPPKKEPIHPQTTAKTLPTIDTSGVKVGSTLTHKAFGVGTVKVIDNQYITLDFNGTEKKFMFPAALLQGFLRID